ncbi:MAG: hypothetical protein Q8O67_00180 [Deltaproteobacteria bacterium]|nr:hypothetical protein [Deltaproteobacteria bacterium]
MARSTPRSSSPATDDTASTTSKAHAKRSNGARRRKAPSSTRSNRSAARKRSDALADVEQTVHDVVVEVSHGVNEPLQHPIDGRVRRAVRSLRRWQSRVGSGVERLLRLLRRGRATS